MIDEWLAAPSLFTDSNWMLMGGGIFASD